MNRENLPFDRPSTSHPFFGVNLMAPKEVGQKSNAQQISQFTPPQWFITTHADKEVSQTRNGTREHFRGGVETLFGKSSADYSIQALNNSYSVQSLLQMNANSLCGVIE